MVADRFVQLDHLTRGRAMLGVGPGALATDALMLGLDPKDARAALETDVDVLMHLLRSDEPISIETPATSSLRRGSSWTAIRALTSRWPPPRSSPRPGRVCSASTGWG